MVKNMDLEKDFEFYSKKDWKKVKHQKHSENRFCWTKCPYDIYDEVPFCRPYDCDYVYQKSFDLMKHDEYGEILTLRFFSRNCLNKKQFEPPREDWYGKISFSFPYERGTITIWEGKVKILLKIYKNNKQSSDVFLYYQTPFPEYKRLMSVELPKDNPYHWRCERIIDNPCVQTTYEMRGYLRKYITVDWEDFKNIILFGSPGELRDEKCLNNRLLNKNRQSMIEMVKRRK